MPKKAVELGALAVSRLTEPGFHFVGGVAGLALQIVPSGGRSWILRIRIGDKRRDMGLGGFPEVTLAEAKEAARAARARVKLGVDPIQDAKVARELLRMSQANAVPFERGSQRYLETHEASWRHQKRGSQCHRQTPPPSKPMSGLSDVQVGMAVKAARKAAGWIAKDLAEQCGIGATAISKIESGNQSLSFITAHQICSALGLDIQQFASLVEKLASYADERAAISIQLKADLTRLEQVAINAARAPAAEESVGD